MKYDLIISDFDWTLGERDFIEPKTVEAIKKFQDKGGKFAVCTGRIYPMIKTVCNNNGFNCYFSTSQGAEVWDGEKNERIYKSSIDKKLAVKIVRQAIEDKLFPAVHLGSSVCYQGKSKYAELYDGMDFVNKINSASLVSLIENSDEPILKIIIYDDVNFNATWDKYKKLCGRKFMVSSALFGYIEIYNKKHTKHQAVKKLSKYLKVPYKKIMTVGDAFADIPLVNGKWYGVAVGGAPKELCDVAKETTVPFKDQPIKYLIEKYCL